MKHFIATLLLPSLILISCNNSESGTTEQTSVTDTTLALAVDTTSQQKFIESICNFRIKNETQAGFEIIGTCISDSNESFQIYNFVETYDEYHMNSKYAIVLNPFEPSYNVQSGKDLYSQISSLLNENSISYSMYQGNFEPSIDFQLDGSPDFLLTDESMFRDQYSSSKQLCLFDGVNAIFPTQIRESNEYTESEEGMNGIKEVMKFEQKKNKYPVIHLHHEGTVTFENETGGIEETVTQYDFIWQWTPTKSEWEPGEWLTGLTCNYNTSSSIITELEEKRTLLTTMEDSYTIMENCQRSEAGFFKLTPFSDNLSSHYVVSDHEDGVSILAVLDAIRLNTSTVILFLTTIEKFGPNLDGSRLLSPVSNMIITKKTTPSGDEIEIHELKEYSSELHYTLRPDLYPYIECNAVY